MIFDIQTPIPFFISDAEFKKKIERIQEDFLYRMKDYDEPRFFFYLNQLTKIAEMNTVKCRNCKEKFYSNIGFAQHRCKI